MATKKEKEAGAEAGEKGRNEIEKDPAGRKRKRERERKLIQILQFCVMTYA